MQTHKRVLTLGCPPRKIHKLCKGKLFSFPIHGKHPPHPYPHNKIPRKYLLVLVARIWIYNKNYFLWPEIISVPHKMPTLICFRWPWCSSVWELLYVYFRSRNQIESKHVHGHLVTFLFVLHPHLLRLKQKGTCILRSFQWPTSPWHFSVQFTGGLHQLHCTELSLSCIRFPGGLWTNGSSTLTRILNNSTYHPHSQSPAVSIGTLLQPLKEGLLIRVCVCSFGWKGLALVASLLVTNGKASHAIH